MAPLDKLVQRERAAHVAPDGAYSSRPASYKGALAMPIKQDRYGFRAPENVDRHLQRQEQKLQGMRDKYNDKPRSRGGYVDEYGIYRKRG